MPPGVGEDTAGRRLHHGRPDSHTKSATPRRESGGTMSDLVTWEACPRCGQAAALGWTDEHPVEFDCTTGCRPTAAQLRYLAQRSRVRSWLARISPPGAPRLRIVHCYGFDLPHTP